MNEKGWWRRPLQALTFRVVTGPRTVEEATKRKDRRQRRHWRRVQGPTAYARYVRPHSKRSRPRRWVLAWTTRDGRHVRVASGRVTVE